MLSLFILPLMPAPHSVGCALPTMVLCERIGPLAVLLLLFEFSIINSEILAPPYFNLAEGKNISASATCGVDTEGPELFCKLIGGNSDAELTGDVIQGQVITAKNCYYVSIFEDIELFSFICSNFKN